VEQLANASVVFTPPQCGAVPQRQRKLAPCRELFTKVPICELNPWKSSSEKLVSHFFLTFLTTNDFTGKTWRSLSGHLWDLLNTSSGLENAAIAIAALDCSRRPSLSSVHETRPGLKQTALMSYSSAIRGLKENLADTYPKSDCESTLWITFFLGIFEVCITLPSLSVVEILLIKLS
jgi:hypothetical protein